MKVDIFNTDKKYSIIYADPPWTFKTYSEKGKEHKSAENHYPCMNKEDIQKLISILKKLNILVNIIKKFLHIQ